MNLSSSAQATLLLTSHFSKAGRHEVKPLTNTEWGHFAFWLKEHDMTPGELLSNAPAAQLDGWRDPRIPAERLEQLLGRGHALALAVEQWQRAGLWVLTRSDAQYPKFLKQRLKTAAPPVLYGCGEPALLNRGGLAVVGSRDVDDSDLLFARQAGAKAASESVALVSGGARGVDEAAMLGAMETGGVVVGVLANKLLAQATSSRWRRGLMDGHVVLVSPFYPEAGFSAGSAMARNKYIYCLANAALVVRSGTHGGTINGARENLKHDWVPLWVKPTDDKHAANALLVDEGGHWCAECVEQLDVSKMLAEELGDSPHSSAPVSAAHDKRQPQTQGSLFGGKPVDTTQPDAPCREQRVSEQPVQEPDKVDTGSAKDMDFYKIFVGKLRILLREPATPEDLSKTANLSKAQVQKWLKQAEDEGLVNKLTRPVRYELTAQ